MVLSDRTIQRRLDDGSIEIDPYDPSLLQPSSVDVRVDRYFRVFHNARYPFIDVKQAQEDLTGLVEIDDESPVHPPPRRVRPRLDARARAAPRRPRRAPRRKELARPPRPAHPLDGGLHRPGLGRPRHARALECREPPDHDLLRDEDRPALLRPADRARVDPVRRRRPRLEVPGPEGPDAEPLLQKLRTRRHDGPRHRRNGVRRHEDRPCTSRARASPSARSYAIASRGTTLEAWGCELVEGDVTDAESLRRAAEGIETIVHLVAIIKGKPADFERVMEEGNDGARRRRPRRRACAASSS